MLRLILILTAAVAPAARTAAASPAAGPQPKAEALEDQPLRRVVALLDYVSADYPRAVGPGGEVLSAAEHQEQIGFVQDAARELRADVEAEDIGVKLDALGRAVAARASPAEVASEARALRDQIVQRFHVVLFPVHAPDLSRGAQAYAQACAACHGVDGRPNASIGLETKPPDFSKPDDVKEMSPQRVFSAVTYGVPRTQMPAFDVGLDDAARWNVAFYLLTLAHPEASAHGLDLARAALVPTRYRDLASLSDQDLRARLATAGLSPSAVEEAIAALRRGPFSEPAEMIEAQGLARARHDAQRAAALARSGDRDHARRTLISAYLDHFEPHEAVLRARDANLVTEIEGAFLALRSSIDAGRDPEPDAVRLDALLEMADVRGPGGALVAFVAALAIALREGVEAALLVAAMLALLRKAGRARDANAVHVGWLSALAAGAITWWGSGVLLSRLSGAHRELIEGVLQLVLAALILYASHWLFAAMSSRRLFSTFFQRSMAGASAAVVLGTTFIAVYREMLEVVMFFRSLVLESPGAGGAVAAGAIAGIVALVALVALFQRLQKKLKPRPLLVACGTILSGLAVLMVGNGIRSLQLQGALPLTVWGAFQLPALGLYATREGLLAQGLVILSLAASALWSSTHHGGPAPKDRAQAAV
ncbi:MAG: FTR1 family protein [Myxococcales bacterium]|nr:c-type cytochrome [Myxococcales bacterium]